MSNKMHNSPSERVWGPTSIPPFLYDMTDLGIATLQPDGCIFHANPYFTGLCGYETDELKRLSFSELVARDSASQLTSWLERLPECSGQTVKGEALLRHRHGHTISVNASLTPVFEASGAFSHYLGIFEDISIRKLNECFLNRQNQVLEMIATHENLNLILGLIVRLIEEQAIGVLSMIFLLDEQKRLRLGAAPSWPESFTRAVDGAGIGPRAGTCGAAAFFGRRVVSADISQDDCWGEHRDWIMSYGIRSAWSTPVFDRDGAVIGTVSMCCKDLRCPTDRDFALVDAATRLMGFAIERQEAQNLIMQQQLKLISSSKMAALGEMAAGVAHEINNPLTLIHGYAQKLEMQVERDRLNRDEVRQIVKSIQSGAQRIHTIVRGLRAIAREGENDPFQETSLQAILDETLELCQERIVQAGIQLIVDPLPAGLTLECRAVQIAQVLLNLLNNSYDALQTVTDRWIRVSVELTAEWITLAVTDSGPGVPPELQDQVMQPFFTTKKLTHGTGLGLSISRSIMASHQGRFYLDAASPATRFVCSLPRFQPVTD